MSLKLFLLVAVLTVAATQAAQPRFRGGVGLATGGKACKKYNPPARFRATPNMAFFEKNCKSVAACEWSDGMCGAAAKPNPKPATLVPATVDECKLANAGPTATSAEAQHLCGAAEGCKYFVKAATNFRCCYHASVDKISSCDTPSPQGPFPVPDPVMKPAAKCDGKCCSDPDQIDADMAGSELGGGKCKLGADNKCKRTDDGKTACPSQIPSGTDDGKTAKPSQIASGTKCKPAPKCKSPKGKSPKGAFPVPDPVLKPAAKCDGTCCSDPDQIYADKAGSELGGGKCKLGTDNKCKRTDDGKTACPSQIAASGTMCKPAPKCK